MSSETFSYKGISAGKYVEGTIDALNQEEASFKLKEQKIIITNLTRTKKKVEKTEKKKGGGFSFGKKIIHMIYNPSGWYKAILLPVFSKTNGTLTSFDKLSLIFFCLSGGTNKSINPPPPAPAPKA